MMWGWAVDVGAASFREQLNSGGIEEVKRLLEENAADFPEKNALLSEVLRNKLGGRCPSVGVVKLLLQGRASVDAKGLDGETPLSMAFLDNKYALFALLLSARANPNVSFSGVVKASVLCQATAFNRVEIAAMLLTHENIDLVTQEDLDRAARGVARPTGKRDRLKSDDPAYEEKCSKITALLEEKDKVKRRAAAFKELSLDLQARLLNSENKEQQFLWAIFTDNMIKNLDSAERHDLIKFVNGWSERPGELKPTASIVRVSKKSSNVNNVIAAFFCPPLVTQLLEADRFVRSGKQPDEMRGKNSTMGNLRLYGIPPEQEQPTEEDEDPATDWGCRIS